MVVVVCEIICEKLTAPKTQGSVLRTRSCDLSALLALALVGSCSWSCLLVVQAKTKLSVPFFPASLTQMQTSCHPYICHRHVVDLARSCSCRILLLPHCRAVYLLAFSLFLFPSLLHSHHERYCTTIFISYQLRKN